jgi:hypothetical protein
MDNGELFDAFERISRFYTGHELTNKIAQIESNLKHKEKPYIDKFIINEGLDSSMLQSAIKIKQVAGQINVIIHSVGILNALPIILEDDEKIEYLSLGAGNTGKSFDLETNKRIAEFKFASWKGADTIRQNNTFIDFFNITEYETSKRKCLYVLSKNQVISFLSNNRALHSVLSKNKSVYDRFNAIYQGRYRTVSEYYNDKRHLVEIVDLLELMPMCF